MEFQHSKTPRPPARGKIPKERYEEILRRLRDGEKQKDLASELGVSAEAISQLKQKLTRDQSELRQSLRHRKRLTPQERNHLRLLTTTTSPQDHQLSDLGSAPAWRWTVDRIRELAVREIGKSPAASVLNDLRKNHSVKPVALDPEARPQPPEPHSIDQLDPELAADPDYVRYYLSPLAYEIARRSYEIRLADWERKQSSASPASSPSSPPTSAPLPGSTSPLPYQTPSGQRSGKHRKGSQPPSRRKRKR